ncbi:MAG TPA: LPS assembly lipoprotein LptE [Arenibaculum sp.]|nr:LPS assembly lipoprotein LptE [Arenibaculum sp.]
MPSTSSVPRHLRAVFLLLLLLGGCGFRPIYGGGTGGDVAQDLANVEIGLIREQVGQQLRNELMDRFYTVGRPAAADYRLDTALAVTEAKLAFRKDTTAARAEVRMTATYLLKDRAGAVAFRGLSRSSAGYSILTDQYGTLVNERDAYDQAVERLADDITRRLALYMKESGGRPEG